VNGFISLTPVPAKSPLLRVTSVRPFTRAMADLLIEFVSGIWNSQAPPNLGRVRIEGEDIFAVLFKRAAFYNSARNPLPLRNAPVVYLFKIENRLRQDQTSRWESAS
jgi:hypothetical protein